MKREHVEYLIIHHLGLTRGSMQSIRNRHVDELGWKDVGSNYIVGNGNGIEDGLVLEGRPVEMGACQCRGFNSRSISVLMVGNFDKYYPSRKQWDSLIELVRRLMDEYGIPADKVIGHREAYALRGMEAERSCPGFKFDCDKMRRSLYPHGSEIFTDGNRRRFAISLAYDSVELPDVDTVVQDNAVLINVLDLEKVFDVKVDFQASLRRVEITPINVEDE